MAAALVALKIIERRRVGVFQSELPTQTLKLQIQQSHLSEEVGVFDSISSKYKVSVYPQKLSCNTKSTNFQIPRIDKLQHSCAITFL